MFSKINLQSRLLGLALFALIVFGLVAYNSSLEIRMNQELAILNDFSKYLVKDLNRHAVNDNALQAYLNHENFLPENYFLVIKSDKSTLMPSQGSYYIHTLPYEKLFREPDQNGFFHLHNSQFTWSKIKSNSYNLILLHKLPDDTFLKFFYSLGFPLIIAGILIMSLVYWTTLLLKSLITTLQEKNISMQHMVLHDALTDLPNRFLLQDRIEHQIAISKRDNSPFSVVVIDINRFKEVNDTLGHHFGDALLVSVADTLLENLRDTDTVARIGGDEFALLLPNVNQESIFNIIEHLKKVFYRSYKLGDHTIHVDANMGCSFFPDHGMDTALLIQRADIALYTAKEKNQHYTFYNPKKDKTNIKRFRLSSDLRKAIDNNELELYYQPQINTSNNECDSLEALIRWHHPQNGVISPAEFIPLAEHNGLINSISEWVIISAIKQISEWRNAGFTFTVAINLSSIDIQDPSLPSRIDFHLKSQNVPTNALIVEVTETAIMLNVKNAKKILVQLHNLGVKISLDDFGTGFSSLNHLRHFPIDEVKIDSSFIASMLENKEDLALVKAIIDLSHDLSINVVAEGVETLQEVHMLAKLNCDQLQGYHFSKPIPAHQIINSLQEIKLLRSSII